MVRQKVKTVKPKARAAMRIQTAFRMFLSRRKAVALLQRCARNFLKKRKAVLMLQRCARNFLQKLKGFEAGQKLLKATREERKASNEREMQEFVALQRNLPGNRVLLKSLQGLFDKDQRAKVLNAVLELEYRKQQLVGLKAVKDFLASLRQDLIARCAFGEDVKIQPILLSGPPGSGKRTSAGLIFEELKALNILKDQSDFKEVQEYEELKEVLKIVKTGAVSNFVYISDLEDDIDVIKILKKLNRKLPNAAVVFGLNDRERMQQIFGFYVKSEPTLVELPPLSIAELAEITRCTVEQRGYRFSGGLNTQMLIDVIADQWSKGEIASRNGHLAKIMVERVLNNKHQREPVSFGFTADPAVLLPADFGVSEFNKVELLKLEEEVAKELDSMPGFVEAKRFLKDIKRRVEFVNAGGSPQLLETCMNVVLTGNPGAGKTTFARLMFRQLRALGVLKKDVFIEKNALELKGKYIGHTAPNVRNAIRSARGGCLFLDEAYALVSDSGSKDSFSGEAIRMLLTEIENHRTEVLVIMAGYKDKMGQLLVQDPGLSRRFPLRINLPDYTPLELTQIADKVAKERFGCKFEEGLHSKLERHIVEQHKSEIPMQNASVAVGLVEQAVERMTCRLMDDPKRTELENSKVVGDMLTCADFQIFAASEDAAEQERMAINREIDGFLGMQDQKEYLYKLQKRVEFVRNGGSPKLLEMCMNVVLTGNPGTGKTTFARLMFRTLRAHGVLKKDVFLERNALELKGEYCGQTAPKIKEMFRMAMGGCLFLDEAYALANGDKFSNEAIRMLLTEVENHRTEVLVILAGYDDKMKELMRADPGLARRFPTTLSLKDYAPAELAKISAKVASERFNVSFSDGLEESLGAWIEKHSDELHISSHNGGLAVNLTEEALGRLAERHIALGMEPSKDIWLIEEDFAIR
jgi:SpoVK/Ycf46/Vps4 family AAA+-type ATPase